MHGLIDEDTNLDFLKIYRSISVVSHFMGTFDGDAYVYRDG